MRMHANAIRCLSALAGVRAAYERRVRNWDFSHLVFLSFDCEMAREILVTGTISKGPVKPHAIKLKMGILSRNAGIFLQNFFLQVF